MYSMHSSYYNTAVQRTYSTVTKAPTDPIVTILTVSSSVQHFAMATSIWNLNHPFRYEIAIALACLLRAVILTNGRSVAAFRNARRKVD